MNRDRLLPIAVFSLLAAATAALVLVGIGLVRQGTGTDQRESLEYRTLLTAIDEVLGLEEEMLRFETFDVRVGRRTYSIDTLVVAAAGSRLPSLGVGGYLHEELRRYNRFQRERLALAAQEPEAFERLKPFNPSLFRAYRRADGSLGVTRTAAAWNRRVPSPFRDRWTGSVRAHDADVAWSLYNDFATVPLDRDVRVTQVIEGRQRRCDFEPDGGHTYIYCLSEARTPQAIIRRLASGTPSLLAGWAATEVDGVRVEPGDSARLEPGSLLRIAPLDPVVFGEQHSGVLSSQQWINGRMRRRGNAPAPLDLVASLGRGPIDPAAPPAAGADLALTVNEGASLALTRELDAFVDDLPIPVEFATVLLARASDGGVVALAESGTRSEPGRSRLLERVVPGSAVKPLLAAAILSERPELGSLEIPARSGLIRSVGSAPLIPARQAFRTALNCGYPESGRVDLRSFLRCSNNEYAATLVLEGATTPGSSVEPVRAAGGTASPTPRFVERRVPRSTLLRSALTDGMDRLFGLSTDPTITDTRGRSRATWESLRFSDGSPTRVPFEVLPDASRPALLGHADSDATDLGLLYRYAFGAWENRWNAFDLTNAFARVVTDRRLQVSLAEHPTGSVAEPLGLAEFAWYPELLAGLAGVARDGTAGGLANRWRRAGLPSTVYAKTGTLAEEEARRGSGLYMKSLLFAVGEPAEVPGSALGCGLTGSVYLSFKDGPPDGSLPSYQVQFAERRLARFMAEYWDELGACPEGN